MPPGNPELLRPQKVDFGSLCNPDANRKFRCGEADSGGGTKTVRCCDSSRFPRTAVSPVAERPHSDAPAAPGSDALPEGIARPESAASPGSAFLSWDRVRSGNRTVQLSGAERTRLLRR